MTHFNEAMQNVLTYLATLFLSLGGGTVTGPTTFQQGLTANGNSIVQNANVTTLALGGTTRATAPADGTVQITKSDGTFGTLQLGGSAAATGIKLISSNGTLTMSDGSGGTGAARLVLNGATGTTAMLSNGEVDLGEIEARRASSDSLRLRSTVHARFSSDSLVGWSSGDAGSVIRDTTLFRDSAGVVGVNAGASNTATGTVKLATTAFANGTKVTDTADGVLKVTKSDGTFSSLVLGGQTATTGIRFSPSNGALQINGGDDATGAALAVGTVRIQGGGVIRSGSASPNSAVVGNVGDVYVCTAGGSLTTLWVKESGAGTNTGWIGK